MLQKKSKFITYDVDNIVLTGPNGHPNLNYRVVSLIIRSGQYESFGQYTIWTRHLRTNQWLFIDDLRGSFTSAQLTSYLPDIKIWFLEKI